MSKQPFDDFTGGVVTPRGTVYFEDGVLIIPKQKNKKTPALSGNHDDDFIDENGDVFKTQDDAYEAYTREDFGGDIQSLFSAYTK